MCFVTDIHHVITGQKLPASKIPLYTNYKIDFTSKVRCNFIKQNLNPLDSIFSKIFANIQTKEPQGENHRIQALELMKKMTIRFLEFGLLIDLINALETASDENRDDFLDIIAALLSTKGVINRLLERNKTNRQELKNVIKLCHISGLIVDLNSFFTIYNIDIKYIPIFTQLSFNDPNFSKIINTVTTEDNGDLEKVAFQAHQTLGHKKLSNSEWWKLFTDTVDSYNPNPKRQRTNPNDHQTGYPPIR
ncbi:MAG: hypothetical protein AAF195_03820, partial [Pseudomonadota bacterium]